MSTPLVRFVLVAALIAVAAVPAAAELAVGDPAPDFALVGSDGATHRLADHVGRRGVVLAWFPKAFTSGCTEEMQTLRDAADAIAAYDAAVYLVSLDAPERNRAFAEAEGARQVVLSDPEGVVAKAYGVVGPAGLYANRWTFYIGADGRIAAIDRQVTPATAGADLVRRLGELGFPQRSADGEPAEP